MKRPKLDGFTEIIDRWLREDADRPRKQRHTAKRVLDRLRDEHGFTGGYTIAKAYLREHQRRSREMFVPLHHAPGHAQADFGEAMVVIGGIEQKAHFFVFDLPHSDACYVRAYPFYPYFWFHNLVEWLEESAADVRSSLRQMPVVPADLAHLLQFTREKLGSEFFRPCPTCFGPLRCTSSTGGRTGRLRFSIACRAICQSLRIHSEPRPVPRPSHR